MPDVAAHLRPPAVLPVPQHPLSQARNRLALTITPAGKPIVSNRIEWLREEMLKTRIAHEYCSRQIAAEARPLRQHL